VVLKILLYVKSFKTTGEFLEISYQYNVNDYFEAQLSTNRGSFGYYLILAMGILCLLYEILILIGPRKEIWISVLFLAAWWCIAVLSYPWKLKKDFRKNPNLLQMYTTSIDSERIETRSELSQSTRKWITYIKFKETRNLFLLYLDTRVFEIIPKRAFSAPQLEEFRKYLQVYKLTK